MESGHAVLFSWGLSALILLALLVVGVLTSFVFSSFVFTGFLLGPKLRVVLGPITQLFREGAWLGAPAIVGLTFAGIAMQERPFLGSRPVSPMSARSRIDASQASKTAEMPNRPAWVNISRSTSPAGEILVISSGQYATRAEAEAELMSKASQLVCEDLQQQNAMGPWAKDWRPRDSDVRGVAVKNEYLEVAETDFVSFTHPMYTVWWQVELSPAVRSAFLPGWRGEAVGERIQWVGIGAASMAFLASVLRIGGRVNQLALERHRLA